MFTSRTMQVKVALATKGEVCVDGPLLPDPPLMPTDGGRLRAKRWLPVVVSQSFDEDKYNIHFQ
jgi:hypothetical protein